MNPLVSIPKGSFFSYWLFHRRNTPWRALRGPKKQSLPTDASKCQQLCDFTFCILSCQHMAPRVNLKLAGFCFDSCTIRRIWAHSTTVGRTVNRNMCLSISSLCQSCHQLPRGKKIRYTLRSISLFYHPQETPERFVCSLISSCRFFESPFDMSVIQTSPTVLTIVWLAYYAMCSICSVSNDVSNIKITYIRSQSLFVVENGWKRCSKLCGFDACTDRPWYCRTTDTGCSQAADSRSCCSVTDGSFQLWYDTWI